MCWIQCKSSEMSAILSIKPGSQIFNFSFKSTISTFFVRMLRARSLSENLYHSSRFYIIPPLLWFIIACYMSNNGGFIGKFKWWWYSYAVMAIEQRIAHISWAARGGCVVANLFQLWSAGEEVKDPVAQRSADTSFSALGGNDSVECWAVVDEQPDACVIVQVVQCTMESQ